MGPSPLHRRYLLFQAVNEITPAWEYLVWIMDTRQQEIRETTKHELIMLNLPSLWKQNKITIQPFFKVSNNKQGLEIRKAINILLK